MGVPLPQHDHPAGVVRTTTCRGHAFDEELVCSCGVTWAEHQNAPSRCRLDAQRCKRTQAPEPKAD